MAKLSKKGKKRLLTGMILGTILLGLILAMLILLWRIRSHMIEKAGSSEEPVTSVAPGDVSIDEESSLPQSESVPDEEEESKDKELKDGLRIWVGDSRTEGIRLYAENDPEKDVFIAKVGAGYAWFDTEGVPELEKKLEEEGDQISYVFIDIGVNDCAGSTNNSNLFKGEMYAERINALVKDWPDISFYFYSVCPCSGNYEYLNEEIDHFNRVMLDECEAGFIDTGGYLKLTIFHSGDGLHYDEETYDRIYQYVLLMAE